MSNYASLVKAIKTATTQLQGRAAAAFNQSLVIRNWVVGAYLVEFEQQGKDRAKYGTRLLERVAFDLAKSKLRGLDLRTLRDCRLLFQQYPQIRGTASPEFIEHLRLPPISVPVADNSDQKRCLSTGTPEASIRGTLYPELATSAKARLPTAFSTETVLRLSWSKLQELVRLDDPWKRAFFENECLKGNWSVRQLQRQIGSLLYERTGLSTDKQAVIERARRQEPHETITDLIRDPYVLEFAGLAERPEYHESELESALLSHLQSFLLELGEGFCFEARQRRITVGRQHDYIDLVFYHRRLRCQVLIDLKVRLFKHGDAGQMNFFTSTGGRPTAWSRTTSRPSASSYAATAKAPPSNLPPPEWTISSLSPATLWPSPPPKNSAPSSKPTVNASSAP